MLPSLTFDGITLIMKMYENLIEHFSNQCKSAFNSKMAEKPRLYLRVTAIKMLDCFTTTLGENHSLMICCLQSQCRLMATLNLREFDPKKQHYPFGGLELRASEQKKHI